jgi:hypothetical protein
MSAGVRDSVDGWDTMLQARTSQGSIPDKVIEFFQFT